MEVKYIAHMGDDLRVVNAARVSFNQESEWEPTDVIKDPSGAFSLEYGQKSSKRDTKLINYLASHNHWTPFSHCIITLREKVPIFVARQRFKHMVGFSYNEISRRYVDDEPEFFIPDVWRSRPEGSVKQGSGDNEVTHITWDQSGNEVGGEAKEIVTDFYRMAHNLYEAMLDCQIAPEQARMVLPQSMYTEYYVTGSLAAFARAYLLRTDGHAQKEIQDLAKMWDEIIRPLFPVSWEALTKEGNKNDGK